MDDRSWMDDVHVHHLTADQQMDIHIVVQVLRKRKGADTSERETDGSAANGDGRHGNYTMCVYYVYLPSWIIPTVIDRSGHSEASVSISTILILFTAVKIAMMI